MLPVGRKMKTEIPEYMFRLLSCVFLIAGSALGLPGQQVQQPELDRYSEQAQRAMAGKDWEAAAKALEKMTKLAPGVGEVYGNLGVAYYSLSRVSEAAQAFERALKLDPNMKRAQVMLGLCFAEMGRNQEAVAILAPAFRRPSDRQMGRLIGLDLQRAYVGLQQHDQAMSVADQLLERFPDDPEILFHASRLHADRAYDLMVQLMRGAPDSIWVHYATAEVHESLQHYDLAIAEYRAILDKEPRLPGIHFRLGRVMLARSKDPAAMDEAAREFELELAISPQNADAEYELGELYRQRGQFGPALEHFSRAVLAVPKFAEARLGLARTLISAGKPREALTHLQEAAALNPQDEVPHFLLASAYKALDDSANQQKEMAQFQKLQAAGKLGGVRLPGALAAPQVTRQTIDADISSPP